MIHYDPQNQEGKRYYTENQNQIQDLFPV